jgi:carboxylesterase type B
MTVTVMTAAGKVLGEAIPTGVAFRGIPFAEPPTGARRFRPPTPCVPWDGVRDCRAFGPICPQVQHAETGGVLTALGRLEPTDEDCLFLNVCQAFLPDPDVAPYFAGSGRSVDEVLEVYAASRPGQSIRELLCAVETDQMFTIPAVRLAEAQLRHTLAVWTYRFSWRTPVLGGCLGACHGLDLPFVFEREAEKETEVFVGPAPPHELARAMHGSWVRFAATGDPNGDELPHWAAYETGARRVMNFDTHSALLTDPCAKERRLWDGLM